MDDRELRDIIWQVRDELKAEITASRIDVALLRQSMTDADSGVLQRLNNHGKRVSNLEAWRNVLAGAIGLMLVAGGWVIRALL